MAYSETTVAVDDYVKQADYQRLLDNTKFLHTDILRVTVGASNVIIGDTSRADVKSIGRAVQNSSVDILAGSDTATDARIIVYGSTAASGSSITFVQETGGDPFLFKTPNSAANILSIDTDAITSYADRIVRDVNSNVLYLVGGTMIDPAGASAQDSYIRLAGSGSAAGHSIHLALGEMANDILLVTRVDSNAQQNLFTMQDGTSNFYDPSDSTSYVQIYHDTPQEVSITVASGKKLSIVRDTIEGLAAGAPFYVKSADQVIITADTDGTPYSWNFLTGGGFQLPNTSTAHTTNGVIWYESGEAANKKLRIYIEGAEYYIPYSVP